jgi:hypothetical protein
VVVPRRKKQILLKSYILVDYVPTYVPGGGGL